MKRLLKYLKNVAGKLAFQYFLTLTRVYKVHGKYDLENFIFSEHKLFLNVFSQEIPYTEQNSYVK